MKTATKRTIASKAVKQKAKVKAATAKKPKTGAAITSTSKPKAQVTTMAANKAKAATTEVNEPTAKPRTTNARLKTTLNTASVDAFISTIDEARRADAHALVKLFTRASGWPAKMWGSAIIGFGKYQYTYESGRTGEMCALGFSPRKANFALYVADSPEKTALLAKLGKHKGGLDQCLYINRVADIDLAVLEKILIGGLAQLKKKWPVSAA